MSLREAVVLLELQGPSELKPGVSSVHERVSLTQTGPLNPSIPYDLHYRLFLCLSEIICAAKPRISWSHVQSVHASQGLSA